MIGKSTSSEEITKQDKTRIYFIDMDDTITRSTKYAHNRISARLPSDFFIEGALEFIAAKVRNGDKVAIISHAYFGYQPIVTDALAARGVNLDAFITMYDVVTSIDPLRHEYYTKCHPEKFHDDRRHFINTYGKGASPYMAQLALARMNIDESQYPNISAYTIGDSDCDLLLSSHLNSLKIKSLPIHIEAVPKTDRSEIQALNSVKAHFQSTKRTRIKSFRNFHDFSTYLDAKQNPSKPKEPSIELQESTYTESETKDNTSIPETDKIIVLRKNNSSDFKISYGNSDKTTAGDARYASLSTQDTIQHILETRKSVNKTQEILNERKVAQQAGCNCIVS